MKIILSRKGFDSVSGGCPSPILPDGSLLSLPIPSDDADTYGDLCYGDISYDKILAGLRPELCTKNCHLDPDIREGVRKRGVKMWKPAFGQTGSALGVLRNAGVGPGDLFMFFGLFRQTEWRDGNLRFVRGGKWKHIVYGYLQVGKVLSRSEDIAAYSWHPHSDLKRYKLQNNCLYTPARGCSLCPGLPGFGVLSYREDRVLTMEGKSMATWKPYEFLMPDSLVSRRKNKAKDGGIYYQGQWQELILKENEEAESWARGIISE